MTTPPPLVAALRAARDLFAEIGAEIDSAERGDITALDLADRLGAARDRISDVNAQLGAAIRGEGR